MIHGELEVIEVGDTTSYTNVLMAYDEINLGALLTPYKAVTEPLSANAVINFLKAILLPPSWIKWVSGLQTSYASIKGGRMVFMQAMFLRFTISRKSRKKQRPLLLSNNNYHMHVGNKIRSKR